MSQKSSAPAAREPAVTQCQKRTGSAFGVNAYFPRQQVRVEGEANRFARSSDAGREVRLNFCPACGSTVFWELDLRPDAVGVAAGAFADPDFPALEVAVWARHRYAWVDPPAGIPCLQGQTP